MTQIPKPMLAGRPDSMTDVQLPVIASPKLDGIRCLMVGGHAVSRNFKPIPNRFARQWLESHVPDGFDGELMVRQRGHVAGAAFNAVTSGIMSEDGTPDFFYAVFDYVKDDMRAPFTVRIDDLKRAVAKINDPDNRLWIVPQHPIATLTELMDLEEKYVESGFEGLVVRSPGSPYKAGRSSVNEQYMLKIKRFDDSEAEVLAVLPMMHNENEAQQDAFGRTKRSTEAAGMVMMNTTGAMSVRDIKSGVEFEIGTGLNEKMRAWIWQHKAQVIGRIAKYKFQPSGGKEKPRFPVFLGFRDPGDMD